MNQTRKRRNFNIHKWVLIKIEDEKKNDKLNTDKNEIKEVMDVRFNDIWW